MYVYTMENVLPSTNYLYNPKIVYRDHDIEFNVNYIPPLELDLEVTEINDIDNSINNFTNDTIIINPHINFNSRIDGIYNINGKPIQSITDLYNLINTIFYDLVDVIIKSTLPIFNEHILYRVIGSKSLESYTNPVMNNVKILTYDIEIVGTNNEIVLFLEKMTMQLNTYINYKYGPNRYFIINILRKYNLIDETCNWHYENKSNNIFKYGFIKTNNGYQPCIFIHFILKKNLFTTGLVNNSNQTNNDHNVIYYPCVKFYSSKIKYKPITIANINYGRLPLIINKLLEEIDTRHYNKELLDNLLNVNYFTCNPIIQQQYCSKNIENCFGKNFSSAYYTDKYLSDFIPTKSNIKIVKDILNQYYGAYLFEFIKTHSCRSIFDSELNPFNTSDKKQSINKIAEIVRNVDENNERSLYRYTQEDHIPINLYCQMRNVGLLNDPKILDLIKNFPQTKNDVDNLDNIYGILSGITEYTSSIDHLFKDEFDVVSVQTFLYFNAPNGQIIDSSNLIMDIGSIIYMPNFLSTSYVFFKDIHKFVSPVKVLYKIKIKKDITKPLNWILVDKYSQLSNEKEILIKSGSFFVIESIEYLPVEKINENKYYNIKVITMRLCYDMNDAISHASNFGTENLLYGYVNSNNIIGGSINSQIKKISDPIKNITIINTNTVVMDPELFRTTLLNNYNDILNSYVSIYSLLCPLLNNIYNKISFIHKKITINYNSQKISEKNLPIFDIPNIYSDSESHLDNLFYNKYRKYKTKYIYHKYKSN
ncbi:hypothetical protein QJ850_gp575 [Acanthamoeba polyphaga mimivirus]|uniref:Uncharacterized protein n=1 Tax=Acanthamoeba polyphaga mimivirus Kroon TaxID=3069720 RepID=A0A0G2Y6E9_9VIRU|nr:hypothetical protein QJ850_gp575 [Acanthamoeba polyphaga mimivirus]AKI80124.1 hypothetical protein [Acanthamoeba polyphaga mimivirus Kroon]